MRRAIYLLLSDNTIRTREHVGRDRQAEWEKIKESQSENHDTEFHIEYPKSIDMFPILDTSSYRKLFCIP